MRDEDTSLTQRLRTQGYIHLTGLLSEEEIAPARQAITRDIARHYDPEKERHYSHTSHCPGLRRRRVITTLRKAAALDHIMSELLAREELRFGPAQIAIRWAHSVSHPTQPSWHIDGVPTPDNGVKGHALDPFDVLIGVFLSKTPGEHAGNFTVWPGSHDILSAHFRARGPRALYEGMPRVQNDLGPPTQLVTSPGDVVIAHYLLAHAAAQNASDTDRVAIFFRGTLRSKRREHEPWLMLADCWRHWRVTDPGAPDAQGAAR